MCNWNGSNVSFSCWSIAPLVSWWFCLKPRETRETISNAALFARWPNRNHHQNYIRLLSLSKFITIFSFLLNGNGNLFQSPRKERVQKRRGKVWYFTIPEEVWIKSKGIVFSFLYFGSLFRVRFSLFQLGILNLHAIGSSLGTSYFPNTLCFDRFSPPVFHQFPISTVNQHLGISKLGSEIRIAGFNILQLSISRSGILIVLLEKFTNTRYGYNLL